VQISKLSESGWAGFKAFGLCGCFSPAKLQALVKNVVNQMSHDQGVALVEELQLGRRGWYEGDL
jgi:hypothetical protein